jgi:membrane protein DedA with SNARE-associated domain
MTAVLESLRHWIEQIILSLGYPGIALIMLAENLFPPIPSEFVLPFAGFLVAGGQMSFVGVVAAGTLGSVVGAVILYFFGLWAGEPVLRYLVRRYGRWWLLSEADLDRTIQFFERRGEVVVFFARVVPIFRSLISLPAGMSRMPFGKFLLLTTLGSAIWSTILVWAGVLLGANWEQILGFISRYQRLIVVAAVLAAAVFVGRRLLALRAARASRAAPTASGPSGR